MSLSPGFYGGEEGIDAEEAEKTLRRALDLGITVLNTADFYGGGANLELIGKCSPLPDHPLLRRSMHPILYSHPCVPSGPHTTARRTGLYNFCIHSVSG